jgi:hypothetical protein
MLEDDKQTTRGQNEKTRCDVIGSIDVRNYVGSTMDDGRGY